MKFTNKQRANAEMALRNLSETAKDFYNNADPLDVYEIETGEGTPLYCVTGVIEGHETRDNALTFDELDALFCAQIDMFAFDDAPAVLPYPAGIEIFYTNKAGERCRVSIVTDGTQSMIFDLLRNGSDDITPEAFADEDYDYYFTECGIELADEYKTMIIDELRSYYSMRYVWELPEE